MLEPHAPDRVLECVAVYIFLQQFQDYVIMVRQDCLTEISAYKPWKTGTSTYLASFLSMRKVLWQCE